LIARPSRPKESILQGDAAQRRIALMPQNGTLKDGRVQLVKGGCGNKQESNKKEALI
jgi:hypothetical protein